MNRERGVLKAALCEQVFPPSILRSPCLHVHRHRGREDGSASEVRHQTNVKGSLDVKTRHSGAEAGLQSSRPARSTEGSLQRKSKEGGKDAREGLDQRALV